MRLAKTFVLSLCLIWPALQTGCSTGCRTRGQASPPAAQPSDAASVRAPAIRQLSFLTWNVLADPVYRERRVPAVLNVLARAKADVVALQEVAPWFFRELARQPWVRNMYRPTREAGRVVLPGGQLILVRQPLAIQRARWYVLPGRQRRIVLVASLQVNGRSVAVATTHLESFLEDGPTRALQLDEIFQRLQGANDAVLLGDLNFGDGEQPETGRLNRRYVDVWRRLKPGQPGFTWNMIENPLAKVGAFKTETSRRLDRILVRSASWQPASIQLLGNRAVGRARFKGHPPAIAHLLGDGSIKPGDEIAVFPSDHFGLLAKLRWKSAQ